MGIRGSKPALARPRVNREAVSAEPAKVKGASDGMKAHRKGKAPPLNMRAVAEVLSEYGMNPAVMIVEAIQSGKLDEKTKASIGLSLIEYLQPKLKAVEHKGEVKVDPVQIDKQLEALLGRAGLKSKE